MEELELRHVVFLGSSLTRTACTDGKGTNQCCGHAERKTHCSRAGVEQTVSEHYEQKTATRYVGMLRQILLYDFGAGIKDAAIRDHLALHAGRLNSFDKMAAEVSTVARTRSENDVVPMDVSVLKGKGGRGKDGKGTEGKR